MGNKNNSLKQKIGKKKNVTKHSSPISFFEIKKLKRKEKKRKASFNLELLFFVVVEKTTI
jgi:hypothetical protein